MTLFSDVVKLVDEVMDAIEVPVMVTVRSYTNDGGTGDATPTISQKKAIVERKTRQVRNQEGQLVASSSNVLFLDPTTVIRHTDQIFLPDGKGGPIISIEGAVDQSGQLLSQVYLG
jgi:hypothetical protein